jgi:uncharacterized delta-60 repeat protein
MRFTARRVTAKRLLLPVLVVGAVMAFVGGAQATPGAVDSNYGNGGRAYIDFEGNNDFVTSTFVDESNRMVEAGYTADPVTGDDMAVGRFKLDGSPDLSAFNGPGGEDMSHRQFDLGGNERANGMLIDGGHKLVLAGWTDVNGTRDIAVLRRLIPGGDADTTFNATGPVPGQIIINLGGDDVATTVTKLPSGKYLVGGTTDIHGSLDWFIARITAKGQLDPNFSNASSPMPGVILVDFGGADHLTGIAAYSSVKWFAFGYSDAHGTNDIVAAGFKQQDQPDSGWGGAGTGKLFIDNAGKDDRAYAGAIVNNKKIMFVGSSNGDELVVREKPKAHGLDGTFAGGGLQTIDFGGSNDAAHGLLFQKTLDRQVVTAGVSNFFGDNDFAVARMKQDGSLDSQFGASGEVLVNGAATSDDVAVGVGMESNSYAILVGGYGNANGNYDFMATRLLPT